MTRVDTIVEDGVAVLSIDHPPVNAGNAGQRAALHAALLAAGARDDVIAVVISTAGRHFYAGSDLREFDGPLAVPTLPDVIDAVESLDVPVVAAIRGLALGGGLELALACDVRVLSPEAAVGFPEVTFGIIPGAGGTVRAARLLGAETALDLITSARQVGADEAVSTGLAARIVEPDVLVESAIRVAAELSGRHRLTDVPPVDPVANRAELLGTLPRRHRPNVREAAELVLDGLSRPAAEALAAERVVFDRLRVAPESQDLRYLFFAKQEAAKALRSGTRPRSVTSVGVVGAGTMGAGLARLFRAHGFDVTVVDSRQEALDGLLDSGVVTSVQLTSLADADLVIEAVFEDMAVKQSVLADLEAVVGPGALLVTNTSYLDLDEMSASLREAGRFGGLHFFNPAERNAFVEVIPAVKTSPETRATLGAVAARLGKVPVLSGVADGFIGNRVYADYRAQAEMLVEDGATPRQVDDAVQGLGLAIGPFAVGDMSGLDIAWARRKRLAQTRDPSQRYVSIPDRLCEAGRLGRKAGAGWFAYPDGARRGLDDPEVERIVEECRAAAGIVPRHIGEAEIQARILGAMVAGGAAVRATGTAERASDVDVALTEGFAYPRHTGGPLRSFARLPRSAQLDALRATHASDPVTYAVLEGVSEGRLPEAVKQVLDEVGPVIEEKVQS